MHFPLWVHLLKLYAWYSPLQRGKSWMVRHAFSRLPQISVPIHVEIPGNIYIELWPWIWSDFCTYMMGSPESYHLSYFISRVHSQSIVFDVGAYIGIYSLRAAKIAKEGYVYAFEPNPQSAHRLQESVEKNRINNLILNVCAVGDQAGTAEVALQEYPPMSSILPPSETMIKEHNDEEIISVVTCTLDEYCNSGGIEHVDILKIDVEGAEMLVLEGASNVIETSHPEILIELHRKQALVFGYSIDDAIEYLHKQRYQLFFIHPGIWKPHLIPYVPDAFADAARFILIARPE